MDHPRHESAHEKFNFVQRTTNVRLILLYLKKRETCRHRHNCSLDQIYFCIQNELFLSSAMFIFFIYDLSLVNLFFQFKCRAIWRLLMFLPLSLPKAPPPREQQELYSRLLECLYIQHQRCWVVLFSWRDYAAGTAYYFPFVRWQRRQDAEPQPGPAFRHDADLQSSAHRLKVVHSPQGHLQLHARVWRPSKLAAAAVIASASRCFFRAHLNFRAFRAATMWRFSDCCSSLPCKGVIWDCVLWSQFIVFFSVRIAQLETNSGNSGAQ